MSSENIGSVSWPIHSSLEVAFGSLGGSAAFDIVHDTLAGLLGGSVGNPPMA